MLIQLWHESRILKDIVPHVTQCKYDIQTEVNDKIVIIDVVYNSHRHGTLENDKK